MHQLSPKFQIDLAQKVVDRIQDVYPHEIRHKRTQYFKKWQGESLLGHRAKSDFNLQFYEGYDNDLDLYETIYNIPSDTLIKIAIDLDLEVPGFIPCVPTFKLDLKASYNRAYNSFETAWKLAQTEPENSAGFANSSLESLMKELLKVIDPDNNYDRETSKDLIKIILKAYKMYPYDGLHNEVKTMAQGFISICTAIDDLRSNKTLFHGKTNEDLLIDDSVFSFFIVNAVATVGSFLKSFHELHTKKQNS